AYRRAKTLAVIAAAVAVCALDLDVRGLISEADEHAETITDPRRHVDVLLSLVAAAAAVGDAKWRRRLGERGAALIPPTLAADWPAEVRRGLVQIATTAGALDLAYAIAWAGR